MDDDSIAIISFGIDKSGEIDISVTMDEYNSEVISHFATLFAMIPTTNFQVQSLQILQKAFSQDGEDKLFEEFTTNLLLKTHVLQTMDQDNQKGKTGDEPVIQPTDII